METYLKGICTYHCRVVFKKISRSLNFPTTVKLHVRRHSIKLHVIIFPKMTVFIKFVVSFTIVNNNPSLTIFNYYPSLTIISDDPSLTIDNVIVNEIFFQKQSNKIRSQLVLIKRLFYKTFNNPTCRRAKKQP